MIDFAPRAKKVSIEYPGDAVDAITAAPRDGLDPSSHVGDHAEGNFHGWFYHFVDGPDDGKTTKFDYGRPLLDPWARNRWT